MTISDIIRSCGGTGAIARASEKYETTITYRGVLKWEVNGIPAHWFELVTQLSGADANTIHAANRTTPAYTKKFSKRDLREVAPKSNNSTDRKEGEGIAA